MANDGVYIGFPNSLRPRRRPKKKMFQKFLKINTKISNVVHRCSHSGLRGHLRTICKIPIYKVENSSIRNKLSLRRREDIRYIN